MNAYLAGSIFYYGDELRNIEWARKIREAFPDLELYSPIENTDINGTEGKKKFGSPIMIAQADNQRLDDCDILIACLDGDVIPSGTSAEVGKFHEKISHGDDRLLIGIMTDNRQCCLTWSEEKDIGGRDIGAQQYSYQNMYVTGLIKEVGYLVTNIDDAIKTMYNWMTGNLPD